MIKEAILSIVITLYYGSNDVISMHTVQVPIPEGIELCEKVKKNISIASIIENPIEMDGINYRFRLFCNKKR